MGYVILSNKIQIQPTLHGSLRVEVPEPGLFNLINQGFFTVLYIQSLTQNPSFVLQAKRWPPFQGSSCGRSSRKTIPSWSSSLEGAPRASNSAERATISTTSIRSSTLVCHHSNFFLLFFFEKKLDFVLIVENGYRLILLMILSQNI